VSPTFVFPVSALVLFGLGARHGRRPRQRRGRRRANDRGGKVCGSGPRRRGERGRDRSGRDRAGDLAPKRLRPVRRSTRVSPLQRSGDCVALAREPVRGRWANRLLGRPAAGREQQAGAGDGCDTESAHQGGNEYRTLGVSALLVGECDQPGDPEPEDDDRKQGIGAESKEAALRAKDHSGGVDRGQCDPEGCDPAVQPAGARQHR
jgi:hypothetical protein